MKASLKKSTLVFSLVLISLVQIKANIYEAYKMKNLQVSSLNAKSEIEYSLEKKYSIKLFQIAAKTGTNGVIISWITATESNNNFFSLERSTDAVNWETIGVINGANNSDQKIDYSFCDDQPLTGLQYYRLKQTDFNNMFTYSETITAEYNPVFESKIKLFPNPANSNLTVRIKAEDTNSTLKLINSSGQTKMEMTNLIGDTFNFNISDQDNGIYFVEIIQGGNILRTKLVKNPNDTNQ